MDTSPDSNSQSDDLPLSSMYVLEGAAVQQYNYEIGLYSDSVDICICISLHKSFRKSQNSQSTQRSKPQLV